MNVLILLHKELRDALRSRWLWLFAFTFGVLAFALRTFALTETAGVLGFSRLVAGLINLTLLLVPLVALTLGAQALAGERERRTLSYLLAQPVSRTEVLLGKYFGLALSLVAALTLGFGVAGLAMGVASVDPVVYAMVVGLSLLLGLANLSLGLLVSVLTRRTMVALGAALFIWFGLVLFADLGLMGAVAVLRLRADTIFLLALANPLQVFKIGAVLAIRPDLEVLGPAGLYGVATLGASLGPVLAGILIAWSAVPLLAAGLLFSRRGEM